MTLANRSLAAFSAAMVLCAIAGGYAAYAFDRMTEIAVDVQRVSEVLIAAHQLQLEGMSSALLLDEYLEHPRPELRNALEASRSRSEQARRTVRQQTRLPRVRQLLDEYEETLPPRAAVVGDMVWRATAGATRSELTAARHARDTLEARAGAYLRSMVALENSAMVAALASAQARRSEYRERVLDLAGLTIVLIGLISLLTSRRITRRLLPLLSMAHDVRQAQFRTRVDARGADEIATLAGAFNQMAAELQELDTAKEDFVAVASHQLRTPATAVKANLSSVLDGYFGPLPPEQQEVLQDAYGANERQLEIIHDLLWVARAETGRLTLSKADTDLVQLLESVVAEHRAGIQERAQALEVSALEAPVRLVADAQKLKMVLDNLLSNASKYTPGGGRIVVRLEARTDDVELIVQDTGIGIAAEDRDKLFRKFSRVEDARARDIAGTGLGLYLANEIVKLHGGAITLTSAVGQGSTFRVSLPRA